MLNSVDRRRVEWLKCSGNPAYFLHEYVQIENVNASDGANSWIPFHLWPAQMEVLASLGDKRQHIVLKARQLGLTWLVLGFALWQLLFRPGGTILLFSLRDEEAKELLKRVRGMYSHLPDWLRCRGVVRTNEHEWQLSNGSRAMAFPTTGGRSYTASFVVVDEADFIPGLGDFLNAVKPTIDGGGQIVLLSTVDKGNPLSVFKRIFEAATQGENGYQSIFLPWHARPERNQAWYERVALDAKSMGNGKDDLYQEYPATVEQALAPKQQGKRFRVEWVEAAAVDGAAERGVWAELPDVIVYTRPMMGATYCIGADCAEGDPQSDDSVGCVIDEESGAGVAVLAGKYEPATFARHLVHLSAIYHGAGIMVERNNHGHAVLLALRESGANCLFGIDGKAGWLSNAKGKRLMYDWAAEALQSGAVKIPDQITRVQLLSVEAQTLRAPTGLHDDYADAFCLAVAAWRGVGGSTIA